MLMLSCFRGAVRDKERSSTVGSGSEGGDPLFQLGGWTDQNPQSMEVITGSQGINH